MRNSVGFRQCASGGRSARSIGCRAGWSCFLPLPGTRVDWHAVIDSEMDEQLELRLASPDDAELMLQVITEAFAARQPLDPPADALSDTLADIRSRLADQLGVIACDDSGVAGALFCSLHPDADEPWAMLHRVSVLPGHRRNGVAYQLVAAAAGLAAEAGMRRLRLVARRELPELVAWWQGHGFEIVRELDDHRLLLDTALPALIEVPTADAMRALGVRLAALLAPGDLIVANGELGAGKTTLTQGIAEGLQVLGPVTSPTFVLSRIHRAISTAPQLVHVDAYRLGSPAELDDLDLDETLADSVTLVEWGAGVAEHLAADRLEIDIERSGDIDDETRIVSLRGVGPRWREVNLCSLAGEQEEM